MATDIIYAAAVLGELSSAPELHTQNASPLFILASVAEHFRRMELLASNGNMEFPSTLGSPGSVSTLGDAPYSTSSPSKYSAEGTKYIETNVCPNEAMQKPLPPVGLLGKNQFSVDDHFTQSLRHSQRSHKGFPLMRDADQSIYTSSSISQNQIRSHQPYPTQRPNEQQVSPKLACHASLSPLSTIAHTPSPCTQSQTGPNVTYYAPPAEQTAMFNAVDDHFARSLGSSKMAMSTQSCSKSFSIKKMPSPHTQTHIHPNIEHQRKTEMFSQQQRQNPPLSDHISSAPVYVQPRPSTYSYGFSNIQPYTPTSSNA